MSGTSITHGRGRRYWVSTIALSVLLSGAGLLFASSASAVDTSPTVAYPPPPSCSLTVGSVDLAPNQSVNVSGDDFTPNTPVTLTLDSSATVLGTFTSDSAGKLTAAVTMPSTLTAGSHQIIASANNLSCQIGASDTAVTTSTTPPSSNTDFSGLAFTGFAAITVAVLGGLLLIGGLAFQLIGRRRRV